MLYVVGFIVPTSLRVWVLGEQTRTRKPDGYVVYPIKKPAGIEFSLCPHPNGAKKIGFRVPVAIPTCASFGRSQVTRSG